MEAVANLWVEVFEKRFEVKQTGHIGFGVNDEKELKILNRTIKIDVLNDEMTLEADTKLVKDALETMHVSGGMKSKEHRSRIPRNSHMRIEVCTTNVGSNVAGANGLWLGWRFAWKKEHDRRDREKRQTFSCDTCHVCRRLLRYQAEKLSITL